MMCPNYAVDECISDFVLDLDVVHHGAIKNVTIT